MQRLDYCQGNISLLTRFKQLKNLFAKPNETEVITTIPYEKKRSATKQIQTLDEYYKITTKKNTVADTFTRIRRNIFRAVNEFNEHNEFNNTWIKEYGQIDHNTNYFYIKKLGSKGFLFESTENGFKMFKAEKIITEKSFIRGKEELEQVKFFLCSKKISNSNYKTQPRVNSKLFKEKLMPLIIYEDKLSNILKLKKSNLKVENSN